MEIIDGWRPYGHIALGVSGAVDCLNTPSLLLALRPICDRITAILTPNAARFISPKSLSMLADTDVISDDDSAWRNHITLSKSVELLLVAPASANTLAKLAHGLADNFLTTFALGVESPIVVAPAMAEAMWNNAFVRRNVRVLRKGGIAVIEPTVGIEVATLQPSFGAMPNPEGIRSYLLAHRRQKNTNEFLAHTAR